jgi:hypothetical protein
MGWTLPSCEKAQLTGEIGAMMPRPMSLAVVFKGPEGLVLAADSRVTLTAVSATPPPPPNAPGIILAPMQVMPTYFDNATKLLSLKRHPHLGMVTYGQGAIGQERPRMAHGYIPEFERRLADLDGDPLSVEAVARELGVFFTERWNEADMPEGADPMVFLVAGFDEGEPHGRVFEVAVPSAPEPAEQNTDSFGISWGGMTYLGERLLNGVAPRAIELVTDELGLSDDQAEALKRRWEQELSLSIPYQLLPLQDCIDLATFLVDMTANVMTWTIGIQGVGGDVDVATITGADGFQSIQQKKIHAWE